MMGEFFITRDGRLLDSAPLKDGKGILVFDDGAWVPWKGTVGQWFDSIPVTAEEAVRYCKDSVIPERLSQAIRADTGYYPDPWED